MGGFILFCMIAIPVLLISFGRRKSRYGGYKSSATQSRQQTTSEQLQMATNKEKEQEDAARRQQAEWTKRYTASPLTQTILQAISTPSRRPDEIHIYKDRITGFTGGQPRTFDFTANRVAHFPTVAKTADANDYDFELKLFRPQVCMATAINQLLGNDYDILDKAKRNTTKHFHSDGDFYFLCHYESNYVIMRLKPKTGF